MLIKSLLLIINTIILIVFLTGFLLNMSWFLKSHDIEEFPLRWIVLFIMHLIVIIILIKSHWANEVHY